MVYLKGIHLEADTVEELHRFAGKIVVSRSWFHPTPVPHYDIINFHKLKAITAYLKRRNRDDR